jgi:hypothetical protein
MAGRYGRAALAEDAPGRSQSRSSKSKLDPEIDSIVTKSGAQIDQLVRDLRQLVKAYSNLDNDTDFGRAAGKKIEKIFERCDRLRGVYSGVY